jgi:hypothetical protein
MTAYDIGIGAATIRAFYSVRAVLRLANAYLQPLTKKLL